MSLSDKDIIENNKLIYAQWKLFTKGVPINQEIVSKLVFDSWCRSMHSGVNPHKVENVCVLTNKQQKSQQKLVRQYGNEIIMIRNVAKKKGLNIQIFDANAISIKQFNFNNYLDPEEIKFNQIRDLSETSVGTNSICLAIKENRSIQIQGCEHYNSYFHDYYCSSAPIHDMNGNVLGVINTFSYKKPHTREILEIIDLLASLFDNILLIKYVSKEMSFYDITIKEIIEYLPYGLIFVDEENTIKYFNEKILEIFRIGNSFSVENELNKHPQVMECITSDFQLEKNEILLDIGEKNKVSILISKKNMFDLNNKMKGKVIITEDTQSLLKTASKLRDMGATYTFEDIIGYNEKIIHAKEIALKISKVSSSVLLYGESGTGKELFAQSIHNASPRQGKPFVAINCGAIPSELIESELFGYEAGAFTGASRKGKRGKIELADGGTVFLDEIESMPLNMQIKLLRFLSTGSITKVGGEKDKSINVRIIAATKKDLLTEADKGAFREDLYFRISTFIIYLPSLRERKDDIPVLTNYFVKKYQKQFGVKNIAIEKCFLDALINYDWRGNIRELQNIIERALVLLGDNRLLTVKYLPEKFVKYQQDEMFTNAMAKADENKGLLKSIEEHSCNDY